MDVAELYPPAPAGVPDDWTKPTGGYRLRALAVLVGLLLFLLLYFALIGAVGYLGYLLASNPPPMPKGRGGGMVIVAYVGGLLAILLLFLFLVKGLFKGTKADRSTYLRLTRKEQPELFEFIDRLCAETAAPKPAGVYVSPDVNAAVFYDTSLINLVVPPKKSLLIGAGLVEAITLREFKAVLAHEFGHFSQKSLAIGTYVNVANRVMGDMIYARDSWDRFLLNWCSWDIRVSFPAWGLRGIVWLLRAGLGGAFKGINLLNLSLSRQMEFNADDVAVSVAGSDAIVTTLCRVEFADQCFGASAAELVAAADHGLYSKNIFAHQTDAAATVRKKAKKPEWGIPPAPPARVFEPGEESAVPVMWQSHPPNADRESNAKRDYFPAPADDRSPWVLFRNADTLRHALSHAFYQHVIGKTPTGEFAEPDAVKAFVAAERTETEYDPKYHGLFDDRALSFADLPNLPESDGRPDAVERLARTLRESPWPDLERHMTAHAKRKEEFAVLAGLGSGALQMKGNSIAFRERDVTPKEIPKLMKAVGKELEEDHKRFGEWDRAMYTLHYQAAHRLDPDRAVDLRRRYVFQKTVQDMVVALNRQESEIQEALGRASGGQLPPEEFRALVETLQSARDDLAEVIKTAKSVVCPELSNVADGTMLIDLIKTPSDTFRLPHFNADDGIHGEDVGHLMAAFHDTLSRLRRVFFKGLGNVLSRQEKIAAEFLGSVSLHS